MIFSSLDLPLFCLSFTEKRRSPSEGTLDWHPASQNSQLEPFQVWEVHSCQGALDYNTGRATGRQMLLLRLHQAPSSKTSVLVSLRQYGNLVFAQCLMKPKCLEVSRFFPCFSLSFASLDLHVEVRPGQKKGISLSCCNSRASKHFHLAPAPASLCGAQHHKETPALDIFLPTAPYLWTLL